MTDHDAAVRPATAAPIAGRDDRDGRVVAAAPLVVLVLVLQRRITAGLTSGSLQG